MSKVTPVVVLCVDDDPRALMARSLILSIAGYDVQTASSSDAALRIFSHSHIDLVIADHFLPGRTGAELAATMKQLKPEVLIVLLTAAPEGPAGADHADLVLIKGMDPSRLLAAIDKLLQTRQRSLRTGAGAGGSAE